MAISGQSLKTLIFYVMQIESPLKRKMPRLSCCRRARLTKPTTFYASPNTSSSLTGDLRREE
jgi:hypothetical protein